MDDDINEIDNLILAFEEGDAPDRLTVLSTLVDIAERDVILFPKVVGAINQVYQIDAYKARIAIEEAA